MHQNHAIIKVDSQEIQTTYSGLPSGESIEKYGFYIFLQHATMPITEEPSSSVILYQGLVKFLSREY